MTEQTKAATIVVCQRCDQPLVGEKQHADTAECFNTMKGTLGGARLALQISVDKIRACRGINHAPNKPIRLGRGTVCRDCVALGFATFEAIGTLLITGTLPVPLPMRIPIKVNGAQPLPPPVQPPKAEGAAP